jgi:hypothetical protein
MQSRLLLLSTVFLLSAGCAEPPVQPEAKTIHVRSDASISNPVRGGPPVAKNLFNIVVDPKRIRVNDTPVKDLATLEKLLAEHQQPAITIGTHKCLSSETAAQVITLAQRYTDTPIAFGSYGTYDDPECVK